MKVKEEKRKTNSRQKGSKKLGIGPRAVFNQSEAANEVRRRRGTCFLGYLGGKTQIKGVRTLTRGEIKRVSIAGKQSVDRRFA